MKTVKTTIPLTIICKNNAAAAILQNCIYSVDRTRSYNLVCLVILSFSIAVLYYLPKWSKKFSKFVNGHSHKL